MTIANNNSTVIGWGMANTLDDYHSIDVASGDELAVQLNRSSGGSYLVYLFELIAGAQYYDSSVALSAATTYYCTTTRDETVGTYGTLYLDIYSDASRETLVDSLSVTLHEKEDFQYYYPCQSYNDSVSAYMTGVSQNHDLQEAVELTGTIDAQAGVAGDLTSLAQWTDWKSPGTVASIDTGGASAWSNPDNAKASDDARTTVSLYTTTSDILRCTNFDFSEIPEGSTYLGTEVAIERSQDAGGGVRDETVILRKTSGQIGDNKADTGIYWPSSDAYKSYGGQGDGWNAGLTIADIKDSGTGIDVEAYSNALSEARIDHIRMRHYYIPPPLSGTIEAQSSVQGALSVARKIAGAIAAQAGVAGALKVARELTGAIASEASVQGALRLSRTLTGTVTGQSLIQGILTLGGIENLSGTAAGQSDVSGDLTLGAEEELTGTIAAQSGVSGQLSRIIEIAGAITAQSSVTGELTTGEVLLSGVIAAAATVEGDLAGIWRIIGEAAAKAEVEGVLTVPGPGQRQAGMFLVM